MPSQDQPNSRGSLLASIAIGGLVAGSLDIFVASAINHASPATILRAIASGLIGRSSYDRGAGTVALGLVLQWLMSLAIAAIYGAAGVRLPALFDKPVRSGALYGVGVFIVMGFIVVPLSAAYPKPELSVSGFILNLAANILFGLIVASTLSLMRVGRARRVDLNARMRDAREFRASAPTAPRARRGRSQRVGLVSEPQRAHCTKKIKRGC